MYHWVVMTQVGSNLEYKVCLIHNRDRLFTEEGINSNILKLFSFKTFGKKSCNVCEKNS